MDTLKAFVQRASKTSDRLFMETRWYPIITVGLFFYGLIFLNKFLFQ